MFFFYQLLLSTVILISPLIIFIRVIKGKEDIIRFKEKFCLISKKRLPGKVIWFHGSSVGEIMSIIPILNRYDKENTFNQILVTSSTVSSSKIFEVHCFSGRREYAFFLDAKSPFLPNVISLSTKGDNSFALGKVVWICSCFINATAILPSIAFRWLEVLLSFLFDFK